MDQLNLFGDDMIKITKKEEGIKEKEKANSKKTSSSAKGAKGSNDGEKSKSTPKKRQEIKIFSDWTIHYYGNSFSVTDFVQDIPDSGITTDSLREAMVQEFFEMTKDRTHFDYDAETKRLFPKVTGGAKG
ncbi:hypothetical protein IIE26_27140 (plasmid) [Cytobacillus oceanisediminis]|uniref:hypothetical protein n=1 Tax=Cytobacillus oceanisediminis TaxID=665099 RepID=UPI0018648239|nr:hypothetical protein [Cytobacillus oceanisediminis]QOK30046.1 hypothetical protein IIE26_27140 [Cytobacillus oceanisediminis]